MEEINRYTDRFKLVDGCLTEIRLTRKGIVEKKLCNFAPYITEEITLDDGVEPDIRIKLRGTHQNGRELPEIEIPGKELAFFNWLPAYWGMDCILEVGKNIKDIVRYAIQNTTEHWNGARRVEYVCKSYHRLGKAACSSHRIHEETLNAQAEACAAALRETMQTDLDRVNKLLKQSSLQAPGIQKRIAEFKAQTEHLEQEIYEILMEKLR